MEDTRQPKGEMSGELMGGGAGCVGGYKTSGWGVSKTTSELSVSMMTSGELQPRTRGNDIRGWNKGGGTFHGEKDRCCRES